MAQLLKKPTDEPNESALYLRYRLITIEYLYRTCSIIKKQLKCLKESLLKSKKQ